MTSVNSASDLYSSIGLRTEAEVPESNGAASQQADFLLLMTEQIKHQNPLNPLEGKDFLAQLAQFSQVEELAKLNKAFNELAASVVSDQSLQAASMIGRDALVAGNVGYLDVDAPLRGAAIVPQSAGDVTLNVYDQVGQLVRSVPLGGQTAGQMNFAWDGMMDNGEWAGSGVYRVEVLAETAEGIVALDTLTASRVESVSLGDSGGVVVNLAGVGSVPYSSIRALM